MARSELERITALEVRMDASDARMDAAEKREEETLRLVRELHARMTISKGAVLGATAVLGAIVGTVGFLFKTFAGFVLGTPPGS